LSDGSWRKVAALSEVPPGALKAVHAGRRHYALANVDGTVYALANECPHRSGPLAGGRLLDGQIACAWHGFRFDVRTGRACMPIDHDPATVEPVRIAGESIEILIDDRLDDGDTTCAAPEQASV
jgi:nitrite reductase/ring-hydroxylating ferredoxin subunit